MQRRPIAATAIALAGVALLAACRAGSNDPALPALRLAPAVSAARTTAWGVLVDDPSGRPLAGIPVHLAPWDRGCVKTSRHTASCPGYLPWHTATQRNGKFVLRDVPNQEYLLVIGSDSPSDLNRPTIHDRITLTGGVEHLRAPTLPTIPCIGAKEVQEWCQGAQPSPGITPFPRPAVEKNGDYRLTTIKPRKEKPCAIAFNQKRRARHLPEVVVDEWLTETTREITLYKDTCCGLSIPQPIPYLTGAEVGAAGGNSCAEVFNLLRFQPLTDPRTKWFGGTWYRLGSGSSAIAGGVAEFPPDPRTVADGSVGAWP